MCFKIRSYFVNLIFFLNYFTALLFLFCKNFFLSKYFCGTNKRITNCTSSFVIFNIIFLTYITFFIYLYCFFVCRCIFVYIYMHIYQYCSVSNFENQLTSNPSFSEGGAITIYNQELLQTRY